MIRFKSFVPAAFFVVMVILSYFILKPFLLAIFMGALFAYVLYPLYKIVNRKIHRNISAFLMCFIIFLIIVLPSVFLVKTVVQDSYAVYIGSKQLLASGLSLNDCQNYLCESAKLLMDNPQVQSQSEDVLKSITTWIIKKGTNFLVSIPRFLLNLVIMFLTLFFFLRDGKKFVEKFSDYLNIHKKKYARIISRLKQVVHAIVYGYGLVALLQGALGALGFFIFGIGSPIFWGIIMAILSFIPFFGTGLIWVPASLYLFINGWMNDSSVMMYKAGGLFLYSLVLVGSIDNIIRPFIVGDKADIHPAIIILGIFGGIALLGSIGLLVGPLVLSLTAIVIETYLSNET